MNKIFIVTIFFLVSCSSNNFKKDINFSDEMSFDEFRIKLEEYAISNPYPKIDD